LRLELHYEHLKGAIQANEIRQLKELRAQELFAELDADGDGRIDLAELDQDGDGQITVHDFHRLLKKDTPPAHRDPPPAFNPHAAPAGLYAPAVTPSPAPAPAPAPTPAPVPAPASASAPHPACGRYTCVKRSQMRAAAAMDSAKAGVLEASEMALQVVEAVSLADESSTGETVRCRLVDPAGWVSLASSTGATILSPLASEPAPAAAETVALAPAPAPAPATAAEPAVEPALPLAGYLCVKRSQIRAGAAMDSDKAGVLEVGERVEVLEAVPGEAGAAPRCRLRAPVGWVSEATSKGDTIIVALPPLRVKVKAEEVPTGDYKLLMPLELRAEVWAG
jgi:hypothetical protein